MFLLLIVCLPAFSQNYSEQKALSLINSIQGVKIYEHGNISTLFMLPTEGNIYRKKIGNIAMQDSIDSLIFYNPKLYDKQIRDPKVKYYTQMANSALKLKNKKEYKYYSEMAAGQLADDMRLYDERIYNKVKKDSCELDSLIMNYAPESKGWKVECTIIKDGNIQLVEVHFNTDITKITDILTDEYAKVYDEMLHPKSIKQYNDLSEIYNNRKKIF